MSKVFFYYSNSFPSILKEKKISVVFSTFQAGKVIFLGSQNGRTLNLYAKNFVRPMGIAINGNQIAICSQNSIDLFTSSDVLARNYPLKKNYYDSLYIPQATYYTGKTDIHEIAWGKKGLWAANTAFSALCLMDHEYHFVPHWMPFFISELSPGDKCHLNGFSMKDGEPEHVTMFGKTDTVEGWRKNDIHSGLLIHAETQKILADRLPMPHSPLLYHDNLYFVLSATGEVIRYNTSNNDFKVLASLNRFIRGLAIYGDLLFIGSSAIRESSSAFPDMKVKSETSTAGILVLDLNTGEQVAKITFTDYIKEIFSVHIIENTMNAALINKDSELAFNSVYLSKESNYWIKSSDNKPIPKFQNDEQAN